MEVIIGLVIGAFLGFIVGYGLSIIIFYNTGGDGIVYICVPAVVILGALIGAVVGAVKKEDESTEIKSLLTSVPASQDDEKPLE